MGIDISIFSLEYLMKVKGYLENILAVGYFTDYAEKLNMINNEIIRRKTYG